MQKARNMYLFVSAEDAENRLHSGGGLMLAKKTNNEFSFELLDAGEFVDSWELLSPFFVKALSRTDVRENTIEEVYRHGATGEATACVVRKNEEIVSAFLFYPFNCPGAKAAYIYALGGKDLRGTLKNLLPLFAEFLKEQGYEWMEFQADEALERIYKRYGIVPTTRNMRFYM